MKIIITQRARRDLLNLYDFNANISLNYARKMDEKIRSYIEDLAFFPYIGRYMSEISDKHYRERICEKFRIIYFISDTEDTIFIRYIFSARQDKKTFFEIHNKDIFNF